MGMTSNALFGALAPSAGLTPVNMVLTRGSIASNTVAEAH